MALTEQGRRTYFFGLRGKIFFPLLLLVILSMWLLGLGLLRLTTSALKAQLLTRVKVMASSIETVLDARRDRVPVLEGDDELYSPLLHSLLRTMSEDPDVRMVSIYDGLGREVTGGVLPGAPLTVTPSRGNTGDGTLVYSFPLSLEPGRTGRISVQFTRQGIERQLAASPLMIIVQLAITALALIVFINLLLSLTVLAPIRRLLAATERIGGGDLTHGVDSGGRDELGDLARSFNTMLERLKESEEKVIRSEKMAAVGRIAAGVAHEVGNPLGSVTGYLALLREENLSPREGKEYLDRAGQELDRVNRIMHDLLNYARPPRLEWTELDINALLRDVRELLSTQTDLGEISFRMELEEGLPAVRGDFHGVRQILVNIVLNAAQSMPEGGEVTLRSLSSPEEGEGLRVRIADEGPGIPEADLPHIFEPFFTSRKGGRGSGLGLALCQQTALSMGIAIEVDSKPGKGSSFTLIFPGAQGEGEGPQKNG